MSGLLPSPQRLGPGLPGYLIPFAPLAFAPQRQKGSSTLPSPSEFQPISTHFTAPPAVPDAPTRPLSPVIPNNVRTVRLTAAAGTNLARASSRDRSTLRLPPPRQCFTTRRPSSHTRRRSVRLAPIAEDPRLQPPVGVWPVSQCQWRGSCSHTR